MKLIFIVGFSDILVAERQINGWKKFVSRFRGKLVKMIIDAVSKFDDYSISKDILKKKQQNII